MERSTMFNGKTYTMKMAMFNSYVTNHQRLHHIFQSLYMVVTSLHQGKTVELHDRIKLFNIHQLRKQHIEAF